MDDALNATLDNKKSELVGPIQPSRKVRLASLLLQMQSANAKNDDSSESPPINGGKQDAKDQGGYVLSTPPDTRISRI